MITFRKYLDEHLDYPDPYEFIKSGKDNLDISTRLDKINSALLRAARKPFLTAYIGLGRMSQVLAPYGLFVPQCVFLEGEKGHKNFNITQFGEFHNVDDRGRKDSDKDEHSVYFEYSMNDDGTFDIFCEIVDKKGLDKIQDDVDSELDQGDDD